MAGLTGMGNGGMARRATVATWYMGCAVEQEFFVVLCRAQLFWRIRRREIPWLRYVEKYPDWGEVCGKVARWSPHRRNADVWN